MRIIKLFFISVVFFFGLFTVIGLLIPANVRLSKAINIGAPRAGIIQLVADTGAWKEWHPAFRGATAGSTAGFAIKTLLQNDSLVTVNFTTPKKQSIVNGWQLYRYASTDSITVQWYMDFHLSWYPWQKFGSLFYESTYGTLMQQGLQDLKTAAETRKRDSFPGAR
jgi:hypothetical protein